MSQLGQHLLATGWTLLAKLDADDRAELRRLLASLAVPPAATAAFQPEGVDRLLDVTEKATELGLHPDTLRKMAADGRIWAKKVGREWRFRPRDLPQSRQPAGPGVVAGGSRRRSKPPPSVAATAAAIRGR